METPPSEARKFIRHQVDVPLEINQVASSGRARRGINVSHGGLSFMNDDPIEVGATLELRIPTVEPPFEVKATVIWCKPEDDGFCVGVAFLDAGDAFHVRMVEQVCAIESYRKHAEEEGRKLSTQEAAAEWIVKHADHFPK
ncbi:MAG TPA: PilZ domain-containing protein [Longimicrobiales bacterium]|nr:PilZ domain-containing protein [Longimicrobiales bacterium]